ncbi:MAG TPA: response regulator transcription factor [Acidimicrobiia bacterium]|nr:response regulator transcription factor [Acidimicrobiia bacterium]
MDPSRVLVVDDEDSLLDLVSSALRIAGYQVESEQSGFDALTHVRARPPDLIVLDVNLPDIDGFEVCRRLRRDGHQMPVVFLTARDGMDDVRAGFRQGGDDYVRKPFSLEELTLRIEALLRRRAGENPAPRRLANGGIVLDEDAHLVTVDEAEIQLSPTEFRLLRYLMLNRDRVLSKDQILDYVWQYDFGGNAGIVETYVGYLRRKLGEAEGGRLQTVRGVGYVLRSPPS